MQKFKILKYQIIGYFLNLKTKSKNLIQNSKDFFFLLSTRSY